MEKKACATMSYGTSWPIKLRDNNGETNEGNEAGVNQAAICLWHGRCPHPPPPTVTTSCVTSPPPTHLPPRHYQHALSPCHRHPGGLTTALPLSRPPFSALSTATVLYHSITSHIFLIQTCRILCFDHIIHTYFDCILWDWNILRVS